MKTDKDVAVAKEILDTVLHVLDVSKTEVTGSRGKQRISDARFIAIKIITELAPQLNLTQIGKLVNRDRSTICYALKIFDNLFDTDKAFRLKYHTVKNQLEVKAA